MKLSEISDDELISMRQRAGDEARQTDEDIVETIAAASYTKGLIDGINQAIKDVEYLQGHIAIDNSQHPALGVVKYRLLDLKSQWESGLTPS